jgi:hypothetical protein
MNDDTPTVSKDRLRHWTATALSTGGWLFSLALLAASGCLAGGGAVAWLLFGLESLFAFSILGSAVLGGVGALLLVQRLDDAAARLRQPKAA